MKEVVPFEEFKKLDLRVGRIEAVEEPKKVKDYTSEGMLLAVYPQVAAGEAPPVILILEKEVPEGSLVR